MKLTINLWQLIGFAVTSLTGILLHFLYEWTQSLLIAPFSCVNESIWEHMKIAFWPMLIFAIIQSFYFKDRKDFWSIKLKGILLGIILIPIIFYTFNGVIGKSPDWINIIIFFISIAVTYIYERKQLINDEKHYKSPKIAISILILISLLFIIFTFKTPEIGIFIDPQTNTYGIDRKDKKGLLHCELILFLIL